MQTFKFIEVYLDGVGGNRFVYLYIGAMELSEAVKTYWDHGVERPGRPRGIRTAVYAQKVGAAVMQAEHAEPVSNPHYARWVELCVRPADGDFVRVG